VEFALATVSCGIGTALQKLSCVLNREKLDFVTAVFAPASNRMTAENQ
jgi:hypothetical protein